MTYATINPATGEQLASFAEQNAEEAAAIVGAVAEAFSSWRVTSFDERATALRRVAAVLRERKAEYAALITTEMGKPIGEAEAEIEKCAWNCEWYAEHAARLLADEPVESNATESYVSFVPLGPVLAIMPWNFPFWQVIRFAAPALMAGNTALLKHAPNVPQCALALETLFRDAGLPANCFRNLFISNEVAAAVIADPRVRAVTLTGSDRAGSAVAAEAGRALKKTVLELGGSDPFIVLPDADLEETVAMAVRARFQNSGQSCIAAKRFLVHEAVADTFERRLVEAVARLKVGDPRERMTQVGPLARADLRANLQRQVAVSIDMGARVLAGGHELPGPGYFYAPTVLADVRPEMPVFREETFGPVLALLRVGSAEEAVRLANASAYGLGASIWTRDIDLARRLARAIEAGSVFINGIVASDPRLPFGGVKRSGYGRELSSFGIREFVNVQTVWIGPDRTAPKAVAELARAVE
jgi:acyl-CoA reductase-like NAD-dependent aldehyde dehydrogenase